MRTEDRGPGPSRLEVWVDDRPVHALPGERVLDAVRRRSPAAAADLERDRAWVADGRGEPVGIHGALEGGQRLYVRRGGPDGAADFPAGAVARERPGLREPGAAAPVTRERILALPKVELHVHLDGCLRLTTLLDLAGEQGVRLPAADTSALEEYFAHPETGRSLVEYLTRFDTTLSVMQERPAIERIAYELAEDAHRENVRYFEVRFSPVLHRDRGLGLHDSVEAVRAGLERAERELGVRAGIIICALRHLDPLVSEELAELCVDYKHRGVVGFDLAGPEENFPAKKHRSAFKVVLENNVNITIHAGEAWGADSIHQAIHDCGAHRIGHGTHLFEDRDLQDYVNDHRIPIEVCLLSNVQTGAVETLAAHPLRRYFDEGLRVTVNTDSRLISQTTVTDELLRAHAELGFTWPEIKKLVLNGFKSAFLPYAERRALLGQVSAELDAAG
ncbi:MAG: adenosine deaminase [Gemmatimonadota bacterium]